MPHFRTWDSTIYSAHAAADAGEDIGTHHPMHGGKAEAFEDAGAHDWDTSRAADTQPADAFVFKADLSSPEADTADEPQGMILIISEEGEDTDPGDMTPYDDMVFNTDGFPGEDFAMF